MVRPLFATGLRLLRNPVCAAVLLTASAAPAAPALHWHGAEDAAVRQQIGEAGSSDVVLLVSGEQAGELADCGCPSRPLGGMARIEGYAQLAERRLNLPVLRLSLGGVFDDTIGVSGGLRPDVLATNGLMAQALRSYTAVNLADADLPYIEAEPLAVGVSASMRPTDDRPLARSHRVEVDGATVAFIGLAGPGLAFLAPEHHRRHDLVEALRAAIAEAQADVVVVLGADLGRATMQIAAEPGVDLLLTADHSAARWAPEMLGRAVWVRSVDRGQVLTDVRLTLEDGELTAVDVRSVDLDERIPEDRDVRDLADEARRVRERGLP